MKRRTRFTTIIVAALGGGLLSAPALAAEETEVTFQQLDENGDGVLSQDEYAKLKVLKEQTAQAGQATQGEPAETVQVEEGQTEVTIEQTKPDVTVTQDEPQVTVQPPAGGESQPQDQQQTTPDQQTMGAQGEQQAQTLSEMTIQDLEGKSIQNTAGEKLGSIDKVMRNQQTNEVVAVVKSGGVLGMGAHRVSVPLNQLELKEGRVVWDTQLTQDQIRQQPAFDEQQFAAVENKGQTLGEVMGTTETYPARGETPTDQQNQQPEQQQP